MTKRYIPEKQRKVIGALAHERTVVRDLRYALLSIRGALIQTLGYMEKYRPKAPPRDHVCLPGACEESHAQYAEWVALRRSLAMLIGCTPDENAMKGRTPEARHGWLCERCGQSWGPDVPACNCTPPMEVSTTGPGPEPVPPENTQYRDYSEKDVTKNGGTCTNCGGVLLAIYKDAWLTKFRCQSCGLHHMVKEES